MFFFRVYFFRIIFIYLLCSVLSGCGGGGGSSVAPPPPPPAKNIAPSVSANSQSVNERSDVAITATASDSDGTIASYAWVQKSGPTVTLSNDTSSTVNFTAPDVTQDTDIVLTITVTDDDGATASADVTITITAITINFTVSGIVTDAPVVNATVEFKVADQVFNVTTDANGNYSVDINVDETLADQILKATAIGSGANSPVSFASILGDISSLKALTGADNILTADELFSVNITNVSTALTVLLEQANNNTLIADKASYDAALHNVDTNKLLAMSVAIKLALDFSAQNTQLALPAGTADTLALISDDTILGSYVTSALKNFGSSYIQAQNDIVADANLFDPGTNKGNLTDTYYFYNIADTRNQKKGRMIINQDDTGQVQEVNGSASFSLSQGASGVQIDFGASGFIESELSNPIAQTTSSGRTIKWILQTSSVDILLIQDTTFVHYPNGEFPDTSPQTVTSIEKAVKTNGIYDANTVLQMNQTYSMPLPDTSNPIINPKDPVNTSDFLLTTREMIFSGDVNNGGSVSVKTPTASGDGTITTSEVSYTWSIAQNGHLIITADSSYDYVFLSDAASKVPDVNVLEASQTLMKATSAKGFIKEAPAFTSQSVVGIYDGNVIFDQLDVLENFWLEINTDGTALTVLTNDLNNDGQLSTNEFTVYPGYWSLLTTGNLKVTRYRGADNGPPCFSPVIDPADDAACVLYNEREWQLFQVVGNDYYTHQTFRFYTDFIRNLLGQPAPPGHLMFVASENNIKFTKIANRPVEIPAAAIPTAKQNDQLSKSFREDINSIIFPLEQLIDKDL